MPLLVYVPVRISGMFCSNSAGDYRNSSSFFYSNEQIYRYHILCQLESVFLWGQMVPASSVPCICHFYFHWRAKAQRIPKPICYHMDFRRQTSLAPPDFFMISPFLAPLACWWTFTVVLSSISVVSSTRSCSIKARRIRSHTPPFVHARNLFATAQTALVNLSRELLYWDSIELH